MNWLLLISLTLVSCTSSPKSTFKVVADDGRVATVNLTGSQFYLVTPHFNQAYRDTKSLLVKDINEYASQKGRQVNAIAMIKGESKITLTSVHVFNWTARVRFGEEPFTGPPFTDTSGLAQAASAPISPAPTRTIYTSTNERNTHFAAERQQEQLQSQMRQNELDLRMNQMRLQRIEDQMRRQQNQSYTRSFLP